MSKIRIRKIRILNLLPMGLLLLVIPPLMLIILNRYMTVQLLWAGILDAVLMVGGFSLNAFVVSQLVGRIRNLLLLLFALAFSLAAFLSTLLLTLAARPFFLLYGTEVLLSFSLILFLFSLVLNLLTCGFLVEQQRIREKDNLLVKEQLFRKQMEERLQTSRLHPHFLFNALNLVASRLDQRDLAEETLMDLADLLRFNLDTVNESLIPVSQEMENIGRYLNLQKGRFGERLQWEISGMEYGSVPPLIIQPLVENSVKHNMDHASALMIRIEIFLENEVLIIRVGDSGKGLTEEMAGEGTGLALTARRAELAGGQFVIHDGLAELRLPQEPLK